MNPGTPVGLRERKKLQTRQALGIAAMRLAVEHGLENVRVDAIATAAGVSTRTFNNYFASKYEAICALPVDRARLIGAQLRGRPAGEPFWQAVTTTVLDQHGSSGPPTREWTAGVRLVTGEPALVGEYLKAQAVMQQHLTDAIAERLGTDPSQLLPRVVAAGITVAVAGATERWLDADPPVPLEPLLRTALTELARHLVLPSPPPPRSLR